MVLAGILQFLVVQELFYKMYSGKERDKWYINHNKRHVFVVYSDIDIVNEEKKKIVLSPSEVLNLSLNTFSNQIDTIYENTKITQLDSGGEIVELKLDDRLITFIVDESGSMTWNDNKKLRYSIIEELIKRIEDNYLGDIKYNLLKYNGTPVDIIFFGTAQDSGVGFASLKSLSSLYFADTDANYTGIRVIRNEDHYPTSSIDGEIISDGFFSKIFQDKLTPEKKYYYSVYTYNENYNFSEGTKISVVPRNPIIPQGVSIFKTWVDAKEPGEGEVLIGSGAIRDDYTIALWHFDEGKENIAYDFSDSQADLNFITEPLWIHNEDFTAAGTSGVWFSKEITEGTYNDTETKLGFRFTNSSSGSESITIMMWIYPYSLKENNRYPLIYRANNSYTNYYFGIYGQALEFSIGVENPSVFNPSVTGHITKNILQNKIWQHISVTYDPVTKEIKFYLNGTLIYENWIDPANWSLDSIQNMDVVIGGLGKEIDNKSFFGKITEVSIHNTLRTKDYIASQIVVEKRREIEITTNQEVTVDYYTGLKGDNGDRLIILYYEVPEDSNYLNGNIKIIRKEKKNSTWEEDGTLIFEHTSVQPGIHYTTDAQDFVHNEEYYYKIYSQNTTGNFSYFSDSPSLKISIPVSPSSSDEFFSDLKPDLLPPQEPFTDLIATPGNKKILLRWKNTFSSDERIARVRIYTAGNDYPLLHEKGFTGRLIFSGLSTENKYVHKNLFNDEKYYYSIANIDKYGRFSVSYLTAGATPSESADENIFPVTDVENLHYEVFKKTSISILWDPPEKHFSIINAYFDQVVIFYAAILDEYGKTIPENDIVTIDITPSIVKTKQAEDVFENTTVIFADSDTYSFVVSEVQNGLIKATLSMSSDPNIVSHLESASFVLQVKSYINTQSNSTNEKQNIFEYLSKKITVNFTNPWEIELLNRDNKQIEQTCYWYDRAELSGEPLLRKTDVSFNGIYMQASSPFIVRAKVKYKGEPVSSGQIQVAIWDAEADLCRYAKTGAEYIGNKTSKSETITLPNEIISIVNGYEEKINWEGTITQIPISYVDIPIYAPDLPQSILVYAKGVHAGFSSLRKIYIVFQSLLKIDINTDAPITDGSDIAEQQSIVYIVNPDYPEDKSYNTYPIDESVVQWEIKPIWRAKYASSGMVTSLSYIERSLYSLDNVPIANGVYSYTRNGVGRNVFFGPVEKGDENRVYEKHEVTTKVVYEGLTAEAKDIIKLSFRIYEKEKFQARFLMEMEGGKNIYLNPNIFWADGYDFRRIFISRNPAISQTEMATSFRNCANREDSEIFELNPFQIIHIDARDEHIEILHGKIYELVDEYTGEITLSPDPKLGFIDHGSADIELNDAYDIEDPNNPDKSDTTVIYIRANRWLAPPYLAGSTETGYACSRIDKLDLGIDECEFINCTELGITNCNVTENAQYIYGRTTIFVNDEAFELIGGGNMDTGIPPIRFCLAGPLRLRFAEPIKLDGEEIKNYSVAADYRSIIDIKVEVMFAGKSVPNGTPVYVGVSKRWKHYLESNIFQSSQSVYETYTQDERSYADIHIFSVVTEKPKETIFEKIEITVNYDRNGKTEREQKLEIPIGVLIPRVTKEWKEPEEPSITPLPKEEAPITSAFSGTIVRYNIKMNPSNEWQSFTNMIEEKGDMFVAAVNNELYAIGGLRNNLKDVTSISRTNYKCDMVTGVWEDNENMITPRYGGMTVTIGNDIYTIGGFYCDNNNQFGLSNVLEVFHTNQNKWESLSPIPLGRGIASGTAQHIIIDDGSNIWNYIYILSGISGIGIYNTQMRIMSYNEYILRYCVETNSWEVSRVALNNNGREKYKRETPLSLIKDNKIIIFGGAWEESRENFIYPEGDMVSFDIENKFSTYTILSDASDIFEQSLVPKYFSSIVKCDINSSLYNPRYYIMGGTIDTRIAGKITKKPLDIVEKLEEESIFLYESSNETGSSAFLLPMPVAKYGHGAVLGLIPNDEGGVTPYIYIIGGYLGSSLSNLISIETDYAYPTGYSKCRLDGRQSVSVHIDLKRNNKFLEKDINIVVRGFLKFVGSTSESIDETLEYQKESANYLENRIVTYPVLFTSNSINIKNGKGTLTLIPRSEDLMLDTASIKKRIENYSSIELQDMLGTGTIKEDEILAEGREDVATIKIETGVIREPYCISLEITIVDDEFYGQTIDRGVDAVLIKDGSYDAGIRELTLQESNFVIRYFSDIDWIPRVESLLTANEGTKSQILSEIENLNYSVPFGSSTMYDAVVEASKILSVDSVFGTRKMIYLFTDNDINLSVSSVDEAAEEINNIDGLKKTPILIGNLSILEPITLAAMANTSDTRDINKLSFLTGGQSLTLLSEEYTESILEVFYSGAVGALGYGTFTFTVDLEEIVILNNIIVSFNIPGGIGNASWSISKSEDGYLFIPIETNYKNNTAVFFGNINIRYIKFYIVLITSFGSTDDSSVLIKPLSPSLISIQINYNELVTKYLFFNYEKDISPFQLTLSTDAYQSQEKENISIVDEEIEKEELNRVNIEAGLAKSASYSWIDFNTPSQPTVFQDGKIVVPIRFSQDITQFEQEPLIRIDRFILKAEYGRWDAHASAKVYNKNNEIVDSENYKIYPRAGLVVFASILDPDYQDGDYKIGIINTDKYRIGLKVTQESNQKELEISGLSYMFNTTKDLLPPLGKKPPEAQGVQISPVYPVLYDIIQLSYIYYDVNFEPENKEKTEIKWYINDIHIGYLDNLRKWNDISDVNDPIWKNVFSFTLDDLEEGETILERARKNNEYIIKSGDKINCTVKVNDGTLYGETKKSSIASVTESKPIVYEVELVGIDNNGEEMDYLTTSIDAKVKFSFHSDSDINYSEIIWWVNDEVFKKGRYDEENENHISYSILKPGEYSLTISQLGLKIGNSIYAQVIPITQTVLGDPISTETLVVQNTKPSISGLKLKPDYPNKGDEVIASWNFFDFDIYTANDLTYQANKTGIQWWRKGTGDWVKVYEIEVNASMTTDIFVNEAYEESWFDITEVRNTTDCRSILRHEATNAGEQWRVTVIPNDSIDSGDAVMSNIITIQN